jgi:hypothetical protein
VFPPRAGAASRAGCREDLRWQEAHHAPQKTQLPKRVANVRQRAAILSPIGFFDQNFGWLVRHIDSPVMFIVYGIGGLLLPLALLYMWLKRRAPLLSTAPGPRGG